MADQEDLECNRRLLKPEDLSLRLPLLPNGSILTAEALDRSSQQRQSFAFQSTRSLPHMEPFYSHFYQRASENHNFGSHSAQNISQVLSDVEVPGGFTFKSESDPPLSLYHSQLIALHSATQQFDLSTPSSPESDECLSFRTAPGVIGRTLPIYNCNNASTQTERSPFEEKFLFRESILLGCDLVSDLTEKLPALTNLRDQAHFIRDKTIQSRSQNICSRLVHRAKEPQIIGEYIKTFFRIADTWLDVRNCFGTSEQCSNESCSLDTRDLTNNYMEWMYVSRLLLNSIVKGLATVARDKGLEFSSNSVANHPVPPSRNFGMKVTEQTNWPRPQENSADVAGAGGICNYPPNPCLCNGPVPSEEIQTRGPPRNFIPTETTARFHSQGLTMYPNNFPCYPRMNCADMPEDYLKPSSYGVPRTNIPSAQKMQNISKAKSICFEDVTVNKGYIITLVNSNDNKKGNNHLDGKDSTELSDSEEFQSKMGDSESVVSQEEWAISALKDGTNSGNALEDWDFESQESGKDQKSDTTDQETKSIKNCKLMKNMTRQVRRRLTPHETSLVQSVVQELWKCAVPEHLKHAVKNMQYSKIIKHPIFLESVTNKVKNGSYETLEQFVQDCRRLVTNAFLTCQKDNIEFEKATKFEKLLERLLEETFEQYPNWINMKGDPKDVNYYLNSQRKRVKFPKSAQIADNKP